MGNSVVYGDWYAWRSRLGARTRVPLENTWALRVGSWRISSTGVQSQGQTGRVMASAGVAAVWFRLKHTSPHAGVVPFQEHQK